MQNRNCGEAVQIEKKDCVGQVQKRMSSELWKLVTNYKGHKLSDGKTKDGRGRLTKKRIDSFQVYYGKAIRQNAGNTEAASNEIIGYVCINFKY